MPRSSAIEHVARAIAPPELRLVGNEYDEEAETLICGKAESSCSDLTVEEPKFGMIGLNADYGFVGEPDRERCIAGILNI